jgi:hypothetical protein
MLKTKNYPMQFGSIGSTPLSAIIGCFSTPPHHVVDIAQRANDHGHALPILPIRFKIGVVEIFPKNRPGSLTFLPFYADNMT